MQIQRGVRHIRLYHIAVAHQCLVQLRRIELRLVVHVLQQNILLFQHAL